MIELALVKSLTRTPFLSGLDKNLDPNKDFEISHAFILTYFVKIFIFFKVFFIWGFSNYCHTKQDLPTHPAQTEKNKIDKKTHNKTGNLPMIFTMTTE